MRKQKNSLTERLAVDDAVATAKLAEKEVERLAAEVERLQIDLRTATQTVEHYRQENSSLSAAYISLAEAQKPLQKQNEDVQAIALFLRYNYGQEIKEGRHSNRSLSDVVIGYLARERQAARGGWWRRLFSRRRKPSGDERHETQD